MAYGEQLSGCCGVLEIQGFSKYETVASIRKVIKDHEDSEYEENHKFNCFIATTNSEHQKNTEKALAALGFESKPFKGHHKEGNYLKFWIKFGRDGLDK